MTANKPDADGWIEWNGGECPVSMNMVDVKFRQGIANNQKAHTLDWSINGDNDTGDIIAYRLHKPEQQKSTADGDDDTNLAAKEELEAMGYRPSIEQLAADYRAKLAIAQQAQEEADAANREADAALCKLEYAGEAMGLLVSPIKDEIKMEVAPSLNITDWRDLRVGDEVEYVAGKRPEMVGKIRTVVGFDAYCSYGQHVNLGNNVWPREWRFIRRP